jgi:hypothetical protein
METKPSVLLLKNILHLFFSLSLCFAGIQSIESMQVHAAAFMESERKEE